MAWSDKLSLLGLTPINGEQFEPLDEDSVVRMEQHLGVRLPEDYRLFLLRYGAADFEEYAVFPTDSGGVAPGAFFGSEIEEKITDFSDRLPQGIVPINDDGAGNLICLSVRNDSYGTVFFQNHSIGWDVSSSDIDAAKFKTLAKLTPDFGSFIEGLEPQ